MTPRVYRPRGPYASRRPVSDRFWEKVEKSRPDACWRWTANTDGRYGTLTVERGKSPVKAHRLSWQLVNGPIPKGLAVLHKCDNPSCVNPQHLFLGTQTDNMRDASRKGRIRTPGLRGAAHPNSKLTRDQAREIFLRARAGEVHGRIAADYGISRDNVCVIAKRRSWVEATEDLT